MSDHQNRSNALKCVQATDTNSSRKPHRARNRSWRPHTEATSRNKQAERGKPTQQAPPTNDALLPAIQKFFYLQWKFLHLFLRQESLQSWALDSHAEIGGV